MIQQIEIRKLQANPFRQIEKYPPNREKVDILKGSIQEVGFFGCFNARQNGSYYQIAYGHHRLFALQEIFGQDYKILLDIHKYSDSQMLKMMANENMEFWKDEEVITQTVKSARDFLNKKLEKTDTYEALEDFFSGLTDKEHFHQLKEKGVGRNTILKFLGRGWTQYRIQKALEELYRIENGIEEEEEEPVKEVSLESEQEPIEELEKVSLEEVESKLYTKPIQPDAATNKQKAAPTFEVINGMPQRAKKNLNEEIFRVSDIVRTTRIDIQKVGERMGTESYNPGSCQVLYRNLQQLQKTIYQFNPNL